MAPSTRGHMTCREFRRKHGDFIDDTLSGVDLEGMVRHSRLCEHCSQLDTRVRRALLVARNIPAIEPSAAFAGRLQARLLAERMSRDLPQSRRIEFLPPRRSLSPITYVAIAGAMMTVAGLAGVATATLARDDTPRLSPVVATRVETVQNENVPRVPVPPASIVAAPTDASLWPAAFVDDQAPWHFASDATSGR